MEKKIKAKNFKVVGLTDISIRRILQEDKPSVALALYTAYFEIAQWQETYIVYANSQFMMKRLRIGKDSFLNAKKILKKLNLIADVVKREKGKIIGNFIEVKHLVDDYSEKPQETPKTSHSHHSPVFNPVENPPSGKQETSTPNNKLSTLNNNKGRGDFKKSHRLSYEELDKSYPLLITELTFKAFGYIMGIVNLKFNSK